MTSNAKPILTVSIVVYVLDNDVLCQTLSSLQDAVRQALSEQLLSSARLYLVDNGDQANQLQSLMADFPDLCIELVSGHGNVGYGRGHNLALQAAITHVVGGNGLHLILNPDVIVDPSALVAGVTWLEGHQKTVAVAPAISDGNGGRASSCKRYPSVLDFLLRGFAPGFIKKQFARRLARYDMADLPQDCPSEDIPVISGCFMLFKLPALKSLQGFDPGYFLYFEDFDLSLRAHQLGSLTYLPQMQITHLGGHSAKKGLRHIGMFVRSGWRFFSTHGWRWV